MGFQVQLHKVIKHVWQLVLDHDVNTTTKQLKKLPNEIGTKSSQFGWVFPDKLSA